MKKILLLASVFAITALSISAGAVETRVSPSHKINVGATTPTAILNSFVSTFGNVPVIEWKLRSDGNWRAHFLNNAVLWEATFTPDGILVKSEPSKKKGSN